MKKIIGIILVVVMCFFTACDKKPLNPTDYPYDVETETMTYYLKDGNINVNMREYMQKNEIINTVPVEKQNAAILGNGIMGVTVFETPDSLNFKLGRGDVLGDVVHTIAGMDDLPALGELSFITGTEFYYDSAEFEQRLSLYDAVLTTKSQSGIVRAESEMFVSADEDVLVVKYSDKAREESFRKLTYTQYEGRNAVVEYDAVDGILYIHETYNKIDGTPNGFVIGIKADVPTEYEESSKSLVFDSAVKFDCNLFVSTCADADVANGKATCKEIILSAMQKGVSQLKSEHTAWWNEFFANSFISLSSGGKDQNNADFLENTWYFDMYLTASGARYDYPFKFNGGLWSIEGDYREWSGGYWNWNTRDMYWPLLTAGKNELMKPYFTMYTNALSKVIEQTPSKFALGGPYKTIPLLDGCEDKVGITGAKFPETMAYDGTGVMENEYVFLVLSTGCDISTMYQWYYEYTHDTEFLIDEAYPLIKEVMNFLMSYAGEKGSDGKYHFDPVNGREQWWKVKDSADVIAGSQSILSFLLEVKDIVGADSALVEKWKDFQTNLCPLPSSSGRYLPARIYNPLDRKNSDNPETEMIFPYGITGIGSDDYNKALSTFYNRNDNLSYGWSPESIQAARLGLGDEAYKLLVDGTKKFQVFANGMTHYGSKGMANWDKMFYTEWNGIQATTINEMLLQSYNGVINVFPAIPEGAIWDNSKFTLYAKHGFKVTSEISSQKVKYIALTSTLGQKAIVKDKFANVTVKDSSGKTIPFNVENGNVIFDTEVGKTYILTDANTNLKDYELCVLSFDRRTAAMNMGEAQYGKGK